MSSFIDHTLLQFASSSVESLSIVQSKSRTILHIWSWQSVLKVTSQYGHFQYKSNMIQSCLFSVTNETTNIVTCKIYSTPMNFYKTKFFSNERKHTSMPTVLRVGGGVFTEVCQAISQGASKSVVQCRLLVSLPMVHSLRFYRAACNADAV